MKRRLPWMGLPPESRDHLARTAGMDAASWEAMPYSARQTFAIVERLRLVGRDADAANLAAGYAAGLALLMAADAGLRTYGRDAMEWARRILRRQPRDDGRTIVVHVNRSTEVRGEAEREISAAARPGRRPPERR